MDAEVSHYLRMGEPGLGARWSTLLDEARAGGIAGDGALSQAGRRRISALAGPHMGRFVSLQLELSARASSRFPDGRALFWTSKGLEQATPAIVADHRAWRLAGGPTGGLGSARLVWDTSSGAGSDSLAALRQGLPVIATDLDADSIRCARANLDVAAEAAAGSTERILAAAVRADLRHPPFSRALLREATVIIDPDRRPDGSRREGRPERWSPTLGEAMALLRSAHGGCVKLPPGLAVENAAIDGDTHLEWVSLDGELKELTAWRGAPAPTAVRTATALRSSGASATWSSDDAVALEARGPEALPIAALAPGALLVELDVSLWQSGLATSYAAAHGHAFIEEEAAGMFCVSAGPSAEAWPRSLAGSPAGSPAEEGGEPKDALPDATGALARAWPILDVVRADRKRVREMLRSHGIGPLTVKKRRHPSTSAELEARFRGPGKAPGLLAVFRAGDTSAAVLLGEERPRR